MGENDRLAVVFVHGFASGAATWDTFKARIAEDAELASVDILTPEYATRVRSRWILRPDRRLPTLSTVADVLQSFMETDAAQYDRIVLVCHSMGGLVVQRYLQRMLGQGRGRELARISRIVLFATPNMGSSLLAGLRRELFTGHPQENDLRVLDEEMRDTHAAVIRDVINAKVIGERTCPIPFSVYAGAEDAIVPRASAQGSFPKVGALPGDHFSIIRPTSHEHSSYTTLRRLLLESAADSDPPRLDRHSRGARGPSNRSTPSSVIVSELRTDFDGTYWEEVYHEVREQLSSSSILVVDKYAYPDAVVDVLISVRSANTVLKDNSTARIPVLNIYAEHRCSGGGMFVGICAVGDSCQEAKAAIIEWLPGESEGSFYIEGVPDVDRLYEILTKWIRVTIARSSPLMWEGSRVDRILDLAPDPYEIPGRKLL
ncbi:esterase/lipase family protein [Streptomyces goshikiensis]|uniref:esterase/lipase family protein n=1 Tax=Streptomyces goshikiensis TaxID=1942 RepID=UPI002E127F41|nr:alpha/beta fold hydrolase [Streptomyces goshikiensis]